MVFMKLNDNSEYVSSYRTVTKIKRPVVHEDLLAGKCCICMFLWFSTSPPSHTKFVRLSKYNKMFWLWKTVCLKRYKLLKKPLQRVYLRSRPSVWSLSPRQQSHECLLRCASTEGSCPSLSSTTTFQLSKKIVSPK